MWSVLEYSRFINNNGVIEISLTSHRRKLSHTKALEWRDRLNGRGAQIVCVVHDRDRS